MVTSHAPKENDLMWDWEKKRRERQYDIQCGRVKDVENLNFHHPHVGWKHNWFINPKFIFEFNQLKTE